ncbi:hypothetical protein BdWA1_000036 [Babesia duncani]|uniref:Uncharacterized protein n=1 Tax=Babesia duncani TaxID=323732 RepID=A0AAD9PLF2_9APIC|nr:hypothetical protein BdWA1_000036 [Babesia duncani]
MVPLIVVKALLWILYHRILLSNAALRNHNLATHLISGTTEELCNRLKDPQSVKRCSVISCIGAKNRNQRTTIHKTFKLDPEQSSSLNGPLKPRFDLWEFQENDACKLVLDTELPNASDFDNPIDIDTVVKLCAISKCIIIYLNEEDVKKVKEGYELQSETRKFLIALKFKLASSSNKPLYIILPDTTNVNSLKDGSGNLKQVIAGMFGNREGLEIKYAKEYFDISHQIETNASTINPKDVANIISKKTYPNLITKKACMQRILDHCFSTHKAYLKRLLVNAFKGSYERDGIHNIKYSLVNATLSFYLSALALKASELQGPPLKEIMEQSQLLVSELYIRILGLVQKELVTKLRQRLSTKDKDENPQDIADSIWNEYDGVIQSLIPTISHDQRLAIASKGVKEQLKSQLDNIVKLHLYSPSSTPNVENKPVNIPRKGGLKLPSVSVGLGITTMLRQAGKGNRQGWFIYSYGPLTFTFGYANDRDVAEAEPGTGLLTPIFRLQPKIHFNIAF